MQDILHTHMFDNVNVLLHYYVSLYMYIYSCCNTIIPEVNAVIKKCEHCETCYTHTIEAVFIYGYYYRYINISSLNSHCLNTIIMQTLSFKLL